MIGHRELDPVDADTTTTVRMLLGDVDGNGRVTPGDALRAFKHVLGLAALDTDQQARADVTKDGHITPDDAVRIVRYFLGLPSFVQDTPPPVMMVALAQDTGRSASASQTSNPTVTGTVTDNSPTAVLRAGFEATPSASFADVLADLRPDGHFTLDRARLEPMHGSGLPDGSYTLHLLARTTPATSPPATSPCSSW